MSGKLFFAGQRVVCVYDGHGMRHVHPYDKLRWPTAGRTYTVRGYVPVAFTGTKHRCVLLSEINNDSVLYVSSNRRYEAGFYQNRFRPALEGDERANAGVVRRIFADALAGNKITEDA